VRQRLDLKFSDLGARQLKNIAEPVHVFSLEVGQPAEAKPAPSAIAAVKQEMPALRKSAWSSRLLVLAAALAVLIPLAVGSWYLLGGRLTERAQAAHFSIVVLPFANLSGDPAQDDFADGITENLTTELSRWKDNPLWPALLRPRVEGRTGRARTTGSGCASVLPEAAPVPALSAQLRRPRTRSARSAIRRLRPFPSAPWGGRNPPVREIPRGPQIAEFRPVKTAHKTQNRGVTQNHVAQKCDTTAWRKNRRRFDQAARSTCLGGGIAAV
jgi:hypothetical protein